ncbi:MAG: class I SAM-dependent methyltransferase [Pirellulales bacterium]|nr:class I SAM-dependent methyltransferase [Pirellulales bacterium]
MRRHLFRRLALVGLLLAVASLGACQGLLGTTATAQTASSPHAPSGLKAERALPSRYPYNVKDILRYCRPEKGFWVDLGAGRGQVTIPLIEATGNPVVMIDPDVEAMQKGLAEAREKGLQAKLTAIVGRAEQLPLPDDSIDLLVSRGSIFFWDDPVQGLKEVYRVLRPGGKAMIGGGAGSGYPAWATEKLIAQRKSRLDGDEARKWRHFVAIRRPEQMTQWAEAAGLPGYRVMGKGAISAADPRVGQGVWLLFEKPPEPGDEEKTPKAQASSTGGSAGSAGATAAP